MPVSRVNSRDSGFGWSDETRLKLDDFSGWFRMHIGLCKNRVSRWQPYTFIDLTAGPGKYDPDLWQPDLWGSPNTIPSCCLLAIELLRKQSIPYRGYLFEIDELRRQSLGVAVGNDPNVQVLGDNCLAPASIPEGRFGDNGLIYVDTTGSIPPFDIIAELVIKKGFYKIDVLIHYAATSHKRIRRVHARPYLTDCLRSVDKQYWQVQEPRDQFQWTFLVLSNTKLPVWKGRRFHDVESVEGQHILEHLNYCEKEQQDMQVTLPYRTYAEYLSHPAFLEIRRQVWERAGGRCERCKTRRPVDAHHLKYPVWGTFDVPENLLAVCRRCHAELHHLEATS